MMLSNTNYFARATTLEELEDSYELATSPEILFQDGERSAEEAMPVLLRFRRDRAERESELRLANRNAHLNAQ